MVIVETDFLLALASRSDRNHVLAVEVIRRVRGLRLSPYSLLELDLLISSGRLKVRLPAFYEALRETLSYYAVEVLAPNAVHLVEAWRLRSKYGLSYFDSLHAAVAIVEGDRLASFDKAYAVVKELNYVHPSALLGGS